MIGAFLVGRQGHGIVQVRSGYHSQILPKRFQRLQRGRDLEIRTIL